MEQTIQESKAEDGIQSPVSWENMVPVARKFRDIYSIKPNAPFLQLEFGYYCLDQWKKQGLPENKSLSEVFFYDQRAIFDFWNLGWCEAPFFPAFDTKVLEDRGDYELVRDWAGRHVLYFKGRRDGFMPEYVDHPVKDMKTWENECKWRLDPKTPDRLAKLPKLVGEARAAAKDGFMVRQRVIGGYMYLRSLIGPEGLLYKFYDEPDLIHDCMRTWLAVADAVIAEHQKHVSFDELFLAEDICYNSGLLISPEMVREFLFPYYQQLIANMKARQIDRHRHLFIQIDTDGWCVPAIDLYREIGMDVMSPFEVASGCDVVKIGQEYPDLIMTGGVDKRVLAKGPAEIDAFVDRVFPAMQKRGGYIPTCDHGVPEEVSLKNYLHYRKRALEFA